MQDAVVACKLMTSFTLSIFSKALAIGNDGIGVGGDGDIASGVMAVAREDANDMTTGGVHLPDTDRDGNDKCGSMATSDKDGSSTARRRLRPVVSREWHNDREDGGGEGTETRQREGGP